MRFELEIETDDRRLLFDLAAVDGKVGTGSTVSVPGGATLTVGPLIIRKSFGIPEVLQFIVDTSKDVEIGLLAAWLYDKVKDGRAIRLTISEREVIEITADGIRREIERTVRKE